MGYCGSKIIHAIIEKFHIFILVKVTHKNDELLRRIKNFFSMKLHPIYKPQKFHYPCPLVLLPVGLSLQEPFTPLSSIMFLVPLEVGPLLLPIWDGHHYWSDGH